MNRSRLRKKANKTGNPVDIENYRQQRNFITKVNFKPKNPKAIF